MDSTHVIAAILQAACRDLGIAVPRRARATRHRPRSRRHASATSLPSLAPTSARRARRSAIATTTSRASTRCRCSRACAGCSHDLRAAGIASRSRPERPPRPGPRSSRRASARFFDASRCADEGLPKPHPDMLLDADRAHSASNRETHADGRRHHARPGDGRATRESTRWPSPTARIDEELLSTRAAAGVLRRACTELQRWLATNS